MLIVVKRLLKKEKGQSLVELALILPILLLLIMGIIEYGRIFNAYLLITNASRDGVRQGVIGANDSTIKSSVSDAVFILDKSKLTVTITPTETYRKRGDELKIHVEYPVTIYDPIIGAITGDPYIVKADTTMRVE